MALHFSNYQLTALKLSQLIYIRLQLSNINYMSTYTGEIYVHSGYTLESQPDLRQRVVSTI